MIDFNAILEKLNNIDDYVGGEFYSQYKLRPEYNVYNQYDLESNQLIVSGKKYLILYQTDNTFTKSAEVLLNYYEKIFSVNNIVIDNPRIISLPLGIVDVGKEIAFALCNSYRDFSVFNILKQRRELFKKNPTKFLYMNYRIPFNLKVRHDSLAIINNLQSCDYTNDTFKGESWLLFNDSNCYTQYFDKNLDHIFIACPEGFGIDSYRFYETLYLGRIPVVLHNPVTDMFKDLPILFLNKWEDFAVESKKFIDNFNINNYNFEKLSRNYWKEILS